MKAYFGHEYEYQRMRQQGIFAWDRRHYAWEIDPHDLQFLTGLFDAEWWPQSGRVLELGCGTGSLLRWFIEKGYAGTGLDLSETAIAMAKEQSSNLSVDFQVCDVCQEAFPVHIPVDICIDGHFMHCIYDPVDRRSVLNQIVNVLPENGIFVLMSMCAPVDENTFRQHYPDHLLRDDILYYPIESPGKYEDVCLIEERFYMPMRFLPDWNTLLAEVRDTVLCPMRIQFNRATSKDAVSSLCVAFIKRSNN